MSQTNTPHKHQQRPVEDILDFCTLLGSRMIASGANLERVKLQMNQLQSLNSLCYSIAKHTPSPKDLKKLLDDASNVDEYSDHIVLLGQICAMSLLWRLLRSAWASTSRS